LINQNLHIQPAALDRNAHRNLKVQLPITDWSVANKLNALFVAATEFGDVCREFPIVFVVAGKEPDGTDTIAPIAVFGLAQGQNLYVQGTTWRAQYMPAMLRSYPFCIGRVDDTRFAVCLDTAYAGVNETAGEPLFTPSNEPAELVLEVQKQMEVLEAETQRTRIICRRLRELDLLRDMRFDATLPDGRKHTVDGFLTLDEKKVSELPEATVMELHRNGMLGMMHLHWVSLGNMRRLVQWYADRLPPAEGAPATLQ
jgi:hypothetical protein